MAITSFGRICKYGLLLTYLAMLSYMPISTSASLDLIELRNKVSKFKVNPRGNLWATGHFMGKKSVSDSQVLDDQPSFESKMKHHTPTKVTRSNLEQVIAQKVLKVALQAQSGSRDRHDSSELDKDFVGTLLKSCTAERKR